MRSHGRVSGAVLIAILAVLGGMLPSPAWSQAPTLKIGLQGVFSGELAAYGDRQKGGVLFALSKAGEIKVGGQPLKIELVYADDQGSGEKGPIAAQQLVDARVNVVIGPGFSGPTASAMPIFRQAKIPAVSPFTGANNLAIIGGGWYFRVSQRNECQGEVLAEITRGLGAKKVVVVDDNEGYGTDISKSVAKNLQGSGVQVVGQYHGALGMTDWSPIVQRIRQDGPEVVVYNGYHAEAGRLVQQARDRGVTAKFLGSDGIADPGIFKVALAEKLTDLSAIRTIPPAFVPGTESPEYKQFQGVPSGPPDAQIGSTDMGNVSHVCPTIHPSLAICEPGVPKHSIAFRERARTARADEVTLLAATLVAQVAYELLVDPARVEAAWDAFRATGGGRTT